MLEIFELFVFYGKRKELEHFECRLLKSNGVSLEDGGGEGEGRKRKEGKGGGKRGD